MCITHSNGQSLNFMQKKNKINSLLNIQKFRLDF